jgi:hypothetical protein
MLLSLFAKLVIFLCQRGRTFSFLDWSSSSLIF